MINSINRRHPEINWQTMTITILIIKWYNKKKLKKKRKMAIGKLIERMTSLLYTTTC